MALDPVVERIIDEKYAAIKVLIDVRYHWTFRFLPQKVRNGIKQVLS
jgi:hypothetical protein